MRRTILFWALAAFLALPFTAQASAIWSSIASGGGMLDSATPVYETNGSGITFPLSSTAATVIKIRYNVSNTAETNPSWTTFSISTAGISTTGSVAATLMQTDLTTAANTTVCSVSSGTTSGIKSCTFSSTAIDFTQYNYWIIAVVSRSDPSSFPAIFSLRIN
ncbi:MAG TPA: hypothetical protein VGE98_02075 [Thermoanaerobaculia bacterium]